MLQSMDKWEIKKKWLASIAIFMSTFFVPNNVGILALFINTYPLGMTTANMVTEGELKNMLKIVERKKR